MTIEIKTRSGKTYINDSIVKNGYELSRDRWGWSITDTTKGITWAERNSEEKEYFNQLYKDNFTI